MSMATPPGTTRIMVIRHAEKPGTYDGKAYAGIDLAGAADPESLVSLGWQRAGGLAALLAPSYGPIQPPTLSTPHYLFAADPSDKKSAGATDADKEPSQRPWQTILPLSLKLGLDIDTKHKKKDYAAMAGKALGRPGIVLIAWQHQDIPAIGRAILSATGTMGIAIPSSWPGARYDLVWVFDRPGGSGPVTRFIQVPQRLLAGDLTSVLPT